MSVACFVFAHSIKFHTCHINGHWTIILIACMDSWWHHFVQNCFCSANNCAYCYTFLHSVVCLSLSFVTFIFPWANCWVGTCWICRNLFTVL